MKRRIQRYRLQSDINALQREIKQNYTQLEHEQQEQKRVSKELRRLQHAKQVQSVPSQSFHLNAVKLYHNQVVQATSVSVSIRQAAMDLVVFNAWCAVSAARVPNTLRCLVLFVCYCCRKQLSAGILLMTLSVVVGIQCL